MIDRGKSAHVRFCHAGFELVAFTGSLLAFGELQCGRRGTGALSGIFSRRRLPGTLFAQLSGP